MQTERSIEITMKDHFNFIAMVFCFWLAIYIYAPIFGIYLEDSQFSYSAIGIILGSYGITQILLRLPLGILSDYLQGIRKSLLVSGFLIAFLSNIIFIFFDSFLMILIGRLLVGMTASVWVMATVLYSYYFSIRNSAKAMGTMQLITVATQFFGMAISGYLVYWGGWNLPFWIGAIASIAGAYFAFNIKDFQTDIKEPINMSIKEHLKETIRIPNLLNLSFLSLIAHGILFVTIFGFTPILASSFGVLEKDLIWLIVAFFLPHTVASLIIMLYTFSSRINRIILRISFLVISVFLLLIPEAASIGVLSLYHIGLGFFLGLIFPIFLSEVIKISPSNLKMSAMGLYQSFYALGILGGPFATGIVAEAHGLNEVFLFTGILSLVATVAVFWNYKIN